MGAFLIFIGFLGLTVSSIFWYSKTGKDKYWILVLLLMLSFTTIADWKELRLFFGFD